MEKFEYKNEIIFEETIMNILSQICYKKSKKLFTQYAFEKKISIDKLVSNEIYSKKYIFDGFAPEGIDNERPTIIEIKYKITIKKLEHFIESFIANEYFPLNDCMLLIISPISFKNKKLIIEKYNQTFLSIWSLEDIKNVLKEYPVDSLNFKYMTDFSYKPKKSIMFDESIDKFGESFELKNDFLKKELQALLKTNKISLVLGTGVSSDFGALGWDSLVAYLYSKLHVDSKFVQESEAFKKIGDENLSRSQYIKQNLTTYKYVSGIYSALYKNFKKKKVNSSYTLFQIAEMIRKNNCVRKIISYNYDDFLEYILEMFFINYKSMVSPEDSLGQNLPIFHVHGFLPYESKRQKTKWTKTIILTEDEYFKLYNNSDHWQVAIQLETFKDDICLFIGNSITDYNEKRLLNCTIQKYKKHYAIFSKKELPVNDLALISAYFKATCNVEIIWVDKDSDISKFIQTLYI